MLEVAQDKFRLFKDKVNHAEEKIMLVKDTIENQKIFAEGMLRVKAEEISLLRQKLVLSSAISAIAHPGPGPQLKEHSQSNMPSIVVHSTWESSLTLGHSFIRLSLIVPQI